MKSSLKRASLAIAIIFVGISSLFFLATPAHAARDKNDALNLSLNPAEQQINLRPGQHYEGTITVYNVGSSQFKFTVSAAPYAYDRVSYTSDFVSQDDSTKLSSWLKLSDKTYTVDPSFAVEVPFVIDVPTDAIGGGQYAAILVRSANAVSPGTSVALISEVASIIYGHISGADTNLEGKMTSHSLPLVMLGGKFNLKSTFENSGNIDYQVTETMSVRNIFSGEEAVSPSTVDSGSLVGTVTAVVLPDSKRTVSQVWPGAPQLGVFEVTWKISYLDQNETYTGVVIMCPLWLILLVLALIVVIVIMLVTMFKSDRKKTEILY